jgi:hypothetical protein
VVLDVEEEELARRVMVELSETTPESPRLARDGIGFTSALRELMSPKPVWVVVCIEKVKSVETIRHALEILLEPNMKVTLEHMKLFPRPDGAGRAHLSHDLSITAIPRRSPAQHTIRTPPLHSPLRRSPAGLPPLFP